MAVHVGVLGDEQIFSGDKGLFSMGCSLKLTKPIQGVDLRDFPPKILPLPIFDGLTNSAHDTIEECVS